MSINIMVYYYDLDHSVRLNISFFQRLLFIVKVNENYNYDIKNLLTFKFVPNKF